jgi:hypothetical protein
MSLLHVQEEQKALLRFEKMSYDLLSFWSFGVQQMLDLKNFQ